MKVYSSLMAVAAAAQTAALVSADRPCPVEGNIGSRTGGEKAGVIFENHMAVDVSMYWIDWDNNEMHSGDIEPFASMHQDSFSGHAFRARTRGGTLVMEHVVRSGQRDKLVKVQPCGGVGEGEIPLWDEGRDKEFEALTHDHSAACLPANESRHWSCVKYWTREEVLARNKTEYGFLEHEVSKNRVGDTYDKGYTRQIPQIPMVTQGGAGYLKMTMTDRMKEILIDWYKERREDSMIPHDVIAGGYTNNHLVQFDKVDLDRFPRVHGALKREMQQILQWWTKMRLKHTSTFGVRIYRRDSMLINHVDRMDTHLASAVLQISQEVDADGGWPLEVMLPDGMVGEVYLQPGEMVLYEGAWLRHGRPMRFKGTEFANIFSHFAPLAWKGPKSDSVEVPWGYGYAKGRCTTLADEDPRGACKVDAKYEPHEQELVFGRAGSKGAMETSDKNYADVDYSGPGGNSAHGEL